MDFHELPIEVKHDIEDQSLSILEIVREEVLVIGGWAVRALVGEAHLRFTWDVDGVLAEEDMETVERKLVDVGLEPVAREWGVQFHRGYSPKVELQDDVREAAERIELSGPRMEERDTPHYFEFDLSEFSATEIGYHDGRAGVPVRVPPLEVMAANKLGLPADSKNNFDVAVLLASSDLDGVVRSITACDDWHEVVLRRMEKRKGRLGDPVRWENLLARDAGIDIGGLMHGLDYIERGLRK
ncbi:MAG: hypothetical protein V3V91_09340 [Thermoplasmata archaeon]